jgi:GcrA cell cycle regulator
MKAKTPPPPLRARKPRPAAPPSTALARLTALDARLPDRGCRWPQGDPRDPAFRYCGAPLAVVGASYCADHMRAAYQRASIKEENTYAKR